MSGSFFFIYFICLLQNFQFSVHQSAIKKQCQIVLMIIVKLLIGNRTIITNLEIASLMKNT